jgi:sec-independent protein translocase protein TatB
VFNLSGSELVFIAILGLIVLGPEKLPGAMRRAGKVYREIRNISGNVQRQVNEAMEEPIREVRKLVEEPTKEIKNTATAAATAFAAASGSSNPTTQDVPATPASPVAPDDVTDDATVEPPADS